MAEEQIGQGGSPNLPPPGYAPDSDLADALARVQAAVADRTDGALQESLEVAIEAIDSALEAPGGVAGNQLASVADAMEDALDELEQGKVANLLPLIEQAQSIVPTGASDEPAPRAAIM